jgi:hypothetical protein
VGVGVVPSAGHSGCSYDGERLHWSIDNYQDEGIRHTHWMADDVVKYHRTLSTYVNTLIDSGIRLTRLLELNASAERCSSAPN